MTKHKKGPARKQPAWGPPSVAKHLGRDWKTMTTEERGLLSDTVRFCYNQHSRILAQREETNAEAWQKVYHQRELFRARLAKLRATIRRQANRWRNRVTV
jgi:hypothetical protein